MWGLPGAARSLVMAMRAVLEERALAELDGYADAVSVRYRLLPFLWSRPSRPESESALFIFRP
jgi:hypothetical protein